MKLEVLGSVFVETGKAFLENQPFQLAAALSYYTLLSIAPLLLVIIGLTGFLLGQEAVRQDFIVEVRALVGEEGADFLRIVIEKAKYPERGIVSMIIGFALMILGATTIFAELQVALNRIWGVQAAPTNALRGFLRARLISFAMVIGVGFLLLISLVMSATLTGLQTYAEDYLPGAPVMWQILNIGISLLLVTLLIAALFKFVPDARIAWRDTWIGAFCTALLFTAGKFLIGLYLGQASIGSAYGAAGSAVVLMVWVYYASLILFFGAELTKVIACRHGMPVVARSFARPADAPP